MFTLTNCSNEYNKHAAGHTNRVFTVFLQCFTVFRQNTNVTMAPHLLWRYAIIHLHTFRTSAVSLKLNKKTMCFGRPHRVFPACLPSGNLLIWQSGYLATWRFCQHPAKSGYRAIWQSVNRVMLSSIWGRSGVDLESIDMQRTRKSQVFLVLDDFPLQRKAPDRVYAAGRQHNATCTKLST